MYEVTENLLATMALEFCPKRNAFGTKVFFPENLLVTMALEPYPKKMCSEQEYDFQENLLKALLNLRALQDCSRTSPRALQEGRSGVAKQSWNSYWRLGGRACQQVLRAKHLLTMSV